MRAIYMGVLVALIALVVAFSPVQAAADFNGPHYNLNIIGVAKDKVQDVPAWSNEDRHTMFVPLERKTNIYMTQANATDADPDDDFKVVDANGCDGRAAFELAPGYYEVYARAVGTPGGKVNITPYATFDADEDGVVDNTTTDFYLGFIELSHSKKPTWERVTGLFLADVYWWDDNNNIIDSTTNQWIFDIPSLFEYWWDYNNQGCKVLQVRFYPVDEKPVVENT